MENSPNLALNGSAFQLPSEIEISSNMLNKLQKILGENLIFINFNSNVFTLLRVTFSWDGFH